MCSFDSENCNINCKKFSLCSFYAIQSQLNNIQSQLNFLMETLKSVLESNGSNELKIQLLEEALRKSLTEKTNKELPNEDNK